MSVNKHVDLGLLQLQVLWFLSKKEACGYQLMKQLNEVKNTKISHGVLYPVLFKLFDQKLIRVSREGSRGKKYYVVTPKGTKVLNKNCEEFIKTFSGLIVDYKCSCCGVNIK